MRHPFFRVGTREFQTFRDALLYMMDTSVHPVERIEKVAGLGRTEREMEQDDPWGPGGPWNPDDPQCDEFIPESAENPF